MAKPEEILKILKRSPFILHLLFSQNFNEEYVKNYMWGTISDKEVEIIKRWLKDDKR